MLKFIVPVVLFAFFALALIVIFLEVDEDNEFPTKEEKKLNNLEDDDEHY